MKTSTDTGDLLRQTENDRLYRAALPETLKSNNDQVVLVPRAEWDRIHGLQMERLSATSALVLPFSWKELAARLCDFVLGSSTSTESQLFRFGEVCVDFARMKVSRSSGESITLTSQEFKTLKCFLLNPDRVFSRDELLNEAWGYESHTSTRTVDNHILKLRQKLERDPTRPVHFRTIHGIGYKFVR